MLHTGGAAAVYGWELTVAGPVLGLEVKSAGSLARGHTWRVAAVSEPCQVVKIKTSNGLHFWYPRPGMRVKQSDAFACLGSWLFWLSETAASALFWCQWSLKEQGVILQNMLHMCKVPSILCLEYCTDLGDCLEYRTAWKQHRKMPLRESRFQQVLQGRAPLSWRPCSPASDGQAGGTMLCLLHMPLLSPLAGRSWMSSC